MERSRVIDKRREAQASLYALGTLPAAEVPEFEAAMSRDPRLQLLVRELRGTSPAFAQVAPPPSAKRPPPPEPGGPSGADATPTPAWVGWMPWVMAACFAILCVVLISLGHALRRQAVTLSEDLHGHEQESAALRQQVEQLKVQLKTVTTNHQQRVLTIEKETLRRIEELARQSTALTNQHAQLQSELRRQLGNYQRQIEQLAGDKQALTDALAGGALAGGSGLANARVTLLRPAAGGTPGALAAAVWMPSEQRGILVVEGLPVLPASQMYQLWLGDPKSGAFISGGVLPAGGAGPLRMQFKPAARIESAERFTITIEPGGGAVIPSARIVMASH